MLSFFRRPRYDLLIEPERIAVAAGDVRVEVEPRLWVADNGRIIAVGVRPSEGIGRVIELFAPLAPSERPQLEARLDAFVSVFRHLFRVAQKGSLFMLRPDVHVRGASVLRPLLGGNEQSFLHDALVHAGATNVQFAT
jgi:hypothetical protein